MLVMHQGNALFTIAGTYPTVLKALLECVQNGIDSNAKRIWVSINKKARTMSVRDDGDGVTPDMFDTALRSVCESKKKRGDLGRFGIGLISPLGKCERFTFTSARVGTNDFNQWMFVSDSVKSSAEFPKIPLARRTDLVREGSRAGVTRVSWSTEVALFGVTKDPQINRVTMNNLVESILEKFGRAMLRKGTIVSVRLTDDDGHSEERDVHSSTSTGTPLDEVVMGKPGSSTVFRLFIARRSGGARKGKVLVGECGDDFRVSFSEFIRSTDLVSKDAADALQSGLFEGEILSETATLHPDRTRFQEGQGLLTFCLAINRWFKDIGMKHLERARADKRDEHYQSLGEASMRHIENLIMNNPRFAHLRGVVESFKIGSIGQGHTRLPKKQIVGPDERPSISVTGVSENGNGGGRTGTSSTTPPKKEHPQHHPFLVAGPEGQVRKLVKGSSTGLKFDYTELLQVMWYLDTKTGVLHFNVRHPAWEACEDAGDKHIRQYQEFIAISALTLETMPEEWREHARAFAEDQALALSAMLAESDAFKSRTQS